MVAQIVAQALSLRVPTPRDAWSTHGPRAHRSRRVSIMRSFAEDRFLWSWLGSAESCIQPLVASL